MTSILVTGDREKEEKGRSHEKMEGRQRSNVTRGMPAATRS